MNNETERSFIVGYINPEWTGNRALFVQSVMATSMADAATRIAVGEGRIVLWVAKGFVNGSVAFAVKPVIPVPPPYIEVGEYLVPEKETL